MLPYGAIVLAFSDPLRDKSFRSKAIVTGLMIVLGVFYAAITVADVWRYFSLWEYPGHQIILQVCLSSTACQLCDSTTFCACNRTMFLFIEPQKQDPKFATICHYIHWSVLFRAWLLSDPRTQQVESARHVVYILATTGLHSIHHLQLMSWHGLS